MFSDYITFIWVDNISFIKLSYGDPEQLRYLN